MPATFFVTSATYIGICEGRCFLKIGNQIWCPHPAPMLRSRTKTPYSSQQNSRSTSPSALPQSLEEVPLLQSSAPSSCRPPTPSFVLASYHSDLKTTDSLEALKSIVFVSKSSQTISSSLRSRPVYTQTDNISSPEFIPTNSFETQTDPLFIEKADLVQHLEEIKKTLPKPKVTFNPDQLSDNSILKIQTIISNNTNKISNIIFTSEKRSNSKIRSTLCFYLIPVYILTLVTLVVTIIITLTSH